MQQQYLKWRFNGKFKPCLDPTPEELQKLCLSLRKMSGNDRVLFHYNGHGVPSPQKGDIWTFGQGYTTYAPLSIRNIRTWLRDPAIYVLDCSSAESLFPYFVDPILPAIENSLSKYISNHSINTMNQFTGELANMNEKKKNEELTVFAACRTNEKLPTNPKYPADLFTCCMTTPILIAVKLFIIQVIYKLELLLNYNIC